MDIYEFAMQMEKDGESYYRDLAIRTDNVGLKNILCSLADAEVKHYKILQKMKAHEEVQVPDTKILSEVKNIFAKMKDEKNSSGIKYSEVDLYKHARELEKKSLEFYSEKAEESNDQKQKNILLKIADEEKRHFTILENIINFISKPETWLEDAEWYHLDEY